MSTIATSGRSAPTSSGVRRRPGLAAHLDSRVGQEPREALPQERRVVCDHDPHGISASSVCRRPAGCPRAAAVERADPVGEAAQTGAAADSGSADAVVSHLDAHGAVVAADVTLAFEAGAYFATFASASATMK